MIESRDSVLRMTALIVIPREWQTANTIPLPEVAKQAGLARGDLHNAIRRGLVQPLDSRGGRYGAALLSRNEAEDVLRAARLALLAGIAVLTALRVVKAGISVPVPIGP